jgi:hypothetical protein
LRYDIDPKTLKKASPRETRVEVDKTEQEIPILQPRYKSKAKEQLAMLSGNNSVEPRKSNTSQEGDWNLKPLSIRELEELE